MIRIWLVCSLMHIAGSNIIRDLRAVRGVHAFSLLEVGVGLVVLLNAVEQDCTTRLSIIYRGVSNVKVPPDRERHPVWSIWAICF